jgi:hypothetical protein
VTHAEDYRRLHGFDGALDSPSKREIARQERMKREG